MMSKLPGVEPAHNPYSSASSEIVRFVLTAYSLKEEYNPNNSNLPNNFEPIPLNPTDNTNLQQSMESAMKRTFMASQDNNVKFNEEEELVDITNNDM